ncbi:MAG: alpha/beta fold hydrolase [Lentisphaeria bacterium]|nr:alpha/beta fold hydrolase [Lentisphaeria bacterium]
MKKFFFLLLAVSMTASLFAETAQERRKRLAAERQQKITAQLTEVDYPCSFDQSKQKAYTYIAQGENARPLVVALHTWSGNYKQDCSDFAEYCIQNNWNFIFPNFRGPNWTPQGCGSDAVVADIRDAAEYMKKVAKVDLDRVYLIGGSGGGFATLLMAARHPELWTAVSAWCPITDLAQWHEECTRNNYGYYKHMRAAFGGNPLEDAKAQTEAVKRSPATYLNPEIPCLVDISTGIRDTLVPISHALNAFNLLALPADRIAAEDIEFMQKNFQIPAKFGTPENDPAFKAHKVLFRRQSNRARITLFVGGHNILGKTGLEWLSRQSRKTPADWTPAKATLQQSSELGR